MLGLLLSFVTAGNEGEFPRVPRANEILNRQADGENQEVPSENGSSNERDPEEIPFGAASPDNSNFAENMIAFLAADPLDPDFINAVKVVIKEALTSKSFKQFGFDSAQDYASSDDFKTKVSDMLEQLFDAHQKSQEKSLANLVEELQQNKKSLANLVEELQENKKSLAELKKSLESKSAKEIQKLASSNSISDVTNSITASSRVNSVGASVSATDNNQFNSNAKQQKTSAAVVRRAVTDL